VVRRRRSVVDKGSEKGKRWRDIVEYQEIEDVIAKTLGFNPYLAAAAKLHQGGATEATVQAVLQDMSRLLVISQADAVKVFEAFRDLGQAFRPDLADLIRSEQETGK
jgi:hypothetical protein